MMNKLILLGVILSAGAIGTLAIELDPAYFFLAYNNIALQLRYDRTLKAIVDLPEAKSCDEFVENLKERLETAGTVDLEEGLKRSFYSRLFELSKVGEDCNKVPRVVEDYIVYKELYREMLQKNPEDPRLTKVKLVVDYLDREAEAGKFTMCLKGVKAKMIAAVDLARGDEMALDKFVRTGYGLDFANDIHLLELAKKFNFADRKLNVKRLLGLAEADDEESKSKYLLEHLSRICTSTRVKLNLYHDLYNIVRAVEGQEVEDVSVTFKKFNEYRRICLILQNETTYKQTEEIIERRVKGCGVSNCLRTAIN